MPIRILLADDHPVVRKGLVQFFADEPDLEIVAECDDGEAAIKAVRHYKPDVALLDMRMPGKSGLEVLQAMREEKIDTAAVFLVGNISDDEVMQAMKAGVRGIVLKEMASHLLVQCIRKVAAGGVWLEKESVSRAIEKIFKQEESLKQVREALTPREIDIVKMIAAGLSNRDIGQKLFISEGTVKTHLHSIYEKLGLAGRLQLAGYAREHGLA